MMELSVLVEFAAAVPHLDVVVVVGADEELVLEAVVAVEVVEKELLLEPVAVAVAVVERLRWDAAAAVEEVAE